jgi:hypothetical protein
MFRDARSRLSAILALPALTAALGLTLAPSAAAGAPTQLPFEETFVDVNPCTGVDHTVSVRGTFYEFEGGSGISHRLDQTITTTSGFAGRGVEVSIDHDRIFIVHAVLTNGDSEHILAQVVLVHDGLGTLRVERFELTCVG